MSHTTALHHIFVVLVLTLALAPVAGVSAPAGAQEGPDTRSELVPGVVHRTVHRGEAVAHVAEVADDADASLQVVPAGDRVGAVERTSVLCRRVSCVAAVNGDFRLPGTDLPVGGVVRDGELIRSPNSRHHQLSVSDEGRLAAGPMSLNARLVPTDLEEVRVDSVNVARGEDTLVLYTDAVGASTRSNDFGVEMTVTPAEPDVPLRLGQTVLVEFGALVEGTGDATVPRGGAVLSGHGSGAARLRDLAVRIEAGDAAPQALLRIETEPDVVESLGGTPVLIKDGQRWFGNARTQFVRGRHPRTAVGWNDAGDVWLVVVDGRQPDHSVGMTLGELADFMLDLGATDAINLDGGGTSTFVAQGEVTNRPSDQLVERAGAERVVNIPRPSDVIVNDSVERPSVNALAVTGSEEPQVPPASPLVGDRLDLPVLSDGPPPATQDPASVPGAALPALVGSAPARTNDVRVGALGLSAASGALLTLTLVGVRSRWRSRRLS